MESAVDISQEPVSTSEILSEVRKEEYQPTCFFEIPGLLMQHGRADRVEELAGWVLALGGNVPLRYFFYEADAPHTFNDLEYHCGQRCGVFHTGQFSFFRRILLQS